MIALKAFFSRLFCSLFFRAEFIQFVGRFFSSVWARALNTCFFRIFRSMLFRTFFVIITVKRSTLASKGVYWHLFLLLALPFFSLSHTHRLFIALASLYLIIFCLIFFGATISIRQIFTHFSVASRQTFPTVSYNQTIEWFCFGRFIQFLDHFFPRYKIEMKCSTYFRFFGFFFSFIFSGGTENRQKCDFLILMRLDFKKRKIARNILWNRIFSIVYVFMSRRHRLFCIIRVQHCVVKTTFFTSHVQKKSSSWSLTRNQSSVSQRKIIHVHIFENMFEMLKRMLNKLRN